MTVAISSATDLIDARLNGHNKRVAFIASQISECLGLSYDDQIDVILSGFLHDVGIIGLKDTSCLFELDKEDSIHADVGHKLLTTIPELKKLAIIVRGHHVPYEKSEVQSDEAFKSQLINLADRIDIVLDYNREPLSQREAILKWINSKKGSRFHPEIVQAFNQLSGIEAFWFHLFAGDFDEELLEKANNRTLRLDTKGLLRFGKFFSQMIDFRSPFTATHSSGVAATAVFLAQKNGFQHKDQTLMRIAGYLHDVGKLAVPNTILEKNGKLTKEEFNVIKSHTYYTKSILGKIKDFQQISIWASLHHERLDGTGYPFHLQGQSIPLGSRIMAIADIFTALNEDRPYREGVLKGDVIRILTDMAERGGIDIELTNLALKHYDELSEICHFEQKTARKEYQAFWAVS
ncbi:MAG: HD domain-containing phosphohydrolase [Bacillota bacterium]